MRPLFTAVTTPAPVRELVTLDDLREQLRLKPNDTANDSWLQKAIGRTSRQAEKFCGRIFVIQTYLDTFRPGIEADIGEPLQLGQAPIDSSTFTLTLDGTALDPASYGLDAAAGLVYRLDALPWSSTSSLTAAYAAGFDPVPDDVQLAVLDLCTMDNSGRGRDPMLRAKESPGLGREEYWVGGVPGGGPAGSTIPQDIAGLLFPYRRGLVG